MIPEAYRTNANNPKDVFNLGTLRSTFNVQTHDEIPNASLIDLADDKAKGGDASFVGGEPEKIQTLIPEAYRTVANDAKDVLNLGTQRSTFNV